jgi:hypothetical protein
VYGDGSALYVDGFFRYGDDFFDYGHGVLSKMNRFKDRIMVPKFARRGSCVAV